jgi:hypothetical protein
MVDQLIKIIIFVKTKNTNTYQYENIFYPNYSICNIFNQL